MNYETHCIYSEQLLKEDDILHCNASMQRLHYYRTVEYSIMCSVYCIYEAKRIISSSVCHVLEVVQRVQPRIRTYGRTSPFTLLTLSAILSLGKKQQETTRFDATG